MKRTGRGVNTAPGRPPTPKCDSCGTTMVKASATEWKCPKPDCPLHNQPVNTGVYPT
jgi:tRNA(Ile2) C34 agmatinyltransferase TiaS